MSGSPDGPHLPNLPESAGPAKNPLVPGLAPQPTHVSLSCPIRSKLLEKREERGSPILPHPRCSLTSLDTEHHHKGSGSMGKPPAPVITQPNAQPVLWLVFSLPPSNPSEGTRWKVGEQDRRLDSNTVLAVYSVKATVCPEVRDLLRLSQPPFQPLSDVFLLHQTQSDPLPFSPAPPASPELCPSCLKCHLL